MRTKYKIFISIIAIFIIIIVSFIIYAKFFFTIDFCHCQIDNYNTVYPDENGNWVQAKGIPYEQYDEIPLYGNLKNMYQDKYNIEGELKNLIVPQNITMKEYYEDRGHYEYFNLANGSVARCDCLK